MTARTVPVIRAVAVAALAISLGGCPIDSPPPTLSIAGRDCADRPNLGSAHNVVLGGLNDVVVTVDDSAACVSRPDGTRTAYVLFRLPESAESYIVTVTSRPHGRGIFSPYLTLLDGDGRPLREVSRDALVFRGVALSASIRSRPGEVFLLVSSDPASIGEWSNRLGMFTSTTVVSTGPAFFAIHTGGETTSSVINAHNGVIAVGARSVPAVQ